MDGQLLTAINAFFWIGANVLLFYIAIAVVMFVVAYYALFDPSATTAGKLIFRFMLSLVGVVGLVFIGTYVDPAPGRMWYELPEHIDLWRPLVRFVIYGYVAFNITSLAILLGIRKWRPSLVKRAPDEALVKVRHDTSEIPTQRA